MNPVTRYHTSKASHHHVPLLASKDAPSAPHPPKAISAMGPIPIHSTSLHFKLPNYGIYSITSVLQWVEGFGAFVLLMYTLRWVVSRYNSSGSRRQWMMASAGGSYFGHQRRSHKPWTTDNPLQSGSQSFAAVDGMPCIPYLDPSELTLPGQRQTLCLDEPQQLAAFEHSQNTGIPLVQVALDPKAAQRGRFRLMEYGTLLAVRSAGPPGDDSHDDGDADEVVAQFVEVEGVRVVLTGIILETKPFLMTAATPVIHRPCSDYSVKLEALRQLATSCVELQCQLGFRVSPVEEQPTALCHPTVDAPLSDSEKARAVHCAIFGVVASTIMLSADDKLDGLAFSGEDNVEGLLKWATKMLNKEFEWLSGMKSAGWPPAVPAQD